jgi:catechol 2,3-dioxygenase-like lactoylglutathione lyase family enzyme
VRFQSVVAYSELSMTEVIGIDHIYITVSDVVASERFYDRVLGVVLGFRKNEFVLSGDRHIQYFNRHFGLVRPARVSAGHEPYSAGLHHFCFRVDSKAEVQAVAEELREQGIDATEGRLYPQYAPDYAATFFEDPDGIRLEVTNYRQERRDRHDSWHQLRG